MEHGLGNIGCLLIHGFGGNVEEVRPLAEYLKKLGYKTMCTSLKGHTGKRKDMKKYTYKDWISSAQEDYNRLSKECEKLFLIGFSMGGLIAFQIALKNRVDAVVTLNSPIYYWNYKRVAINIIDDFKTREFKNIKRYVNSILELPIRALINFRILLWRTKGILNKIYCPVFTAQALQDDTVKCSSANHINICVASECKRLQFYDNSGHLILWSKAADNVMNDVAAFLEEVEKSFQSY